MVDKGKAYDDANHGKSKPQKKTADAGNGSVPFRGFINHTPDDREKEDFRQWLEVEGVFGELMCQLLEAGYSIKKGYNNKDSCYSASISRWFARYGDAGLVYTAYSSDPVRAEAKAVWFVGRLSAFDLARWLADVRSVDEW